MYRLPNIFVDYKGKNSNFTVEKPTLLYWVKDMLKKKDGVLAQEYATMGLLGL
jgi:hypothetical protein